MNTRLSQFQTAYIHFRKLEYAGDDALGDGSSGCGRGLSGGGSGRAGMSGHLSPAGPLAASI